MSFFIELVRIELKVPTLWKKGVGTGGSSYNSDTLDFPGVPFSSADFSDYRCKSQNGLINNYGDPNEVRNCRLVGLVDLDHSKSGVRAKIAGFYSL